MKKLQKVFSLLTAAAMVCNVFVLPASANDETAASADDIVSEAAVSYEEETVYAYEETVEIECGDADGNGIIESMDAAIVLQKALNKGGYTMPIEELLPDSYMDIVDADRDGDITSFDAAAIFQKVLNGSFVLPISGDSIETTTVEKATETTTEATTKASSGSDETTVTTTEGETETTTELSIELQDNNTLVNGLAQSNDYVTLDNTANVITITAPGVYNISGSLSDGQIVVDVADTYSTNNVEMNLSDVSVTNSSGPAIYGLSGDIEISAKKGTTSTLSDGTPTVFETETAEDGTVTETEEPDACIFSHDGVKLKGKGTLIINGNYQNGVSGKDEVEIKNLTLTVNAVNNAIKGKDYVTVSSGTLDLTSKIGDGIRCTKGDITIEDGSVTVNGTDNGLFAKAGNIIVSGGTLDITVVPGGTADTTTYNYDGIHTKVGTVSITGGNITVKSYCDGIQAAGDMTISGEPVINVTTTGAISSSTGYGSTSQTSDISAKGIKSDTNLTIEGGTFTINSTDDSIHTNGNITIGAASISVSSSDDGVHADSVLTINEGCELLVSKSYEGIEAEEIYINGGTMNIYASDDNINAAGGNDGSSQGGFNANAYGYIEINGGYIYCENSSANGDGVDSNGKIVMNGGTVIVNGPTSDGDAPIDTGDSSGDGLYYNGGTIIAVGSSGMAEAPESSSTGYSVTYGVNAGGGFGGPGGNMGFGGPGGNGNSSSTTSIPANTLVTLADGSGNVIAALKTKVAAKSVVICSDNIKQGTTYTLATGGTYTGTLDDNGFAEGGSISGATAVAQANVTSKVTALTTVN